MSKALFFGVAAIGGMAFLTLVSRYSICRSMMETGASGGGNEETNSAAAGTCSGKICGPKEGEVLKGENELTTSDEQWREKLTPRQFDVTPQGNRARVYRRVLELPQGRRLSLRVLRRAAVQFPDQIRLRHRLAELLEAH